jgi:hypothetical protein
METIGAWCCSRKGAHLRHKTKQHNMLLYSYLIPTSERTAFENKVTDVANKLNTNPDWLMQVMKAESGLRADIQNPIEMQGGHATGLIQFAPDTAKALGTTTDALKKMSRVQQMDYVYKYFEPYKGKLNSYFDVYLPVFFPAAIGHTNDDAYVFKTSRISAAAVAKANPSIDVNKDGVVTMADFKAYLKKTVDQKYWDQVFGSSVQAIKDHPFVTIGATVFIVITSYLAYHYFVSKKSK